VALTNLLVRLPNPLGDVVMATPFLQGLRKVYPENRIILAGQKVHQGLLETADFCDAYLALPPRQAGWKGVKDQANALQNAQAQSIYILPNSFSSALAALLAKIPRRYGRRHAGRRFLLTHPLQSLGKARPMTEIYWEMLAGKAGVKIPPCQLPPQVAKPKLPTLEKGQAWLAVSPGAAFGPTKQYPLPLLTQALAQIQSQLHLHPLLLGAESEAPLLEDLSKQLKTAGVAYHSTHLSPPSLAESLSWFAACDLALTMDSGARHLAAAVGIPQIVFYGPTNSAWSAYGLNELTKIQKENLSCLGCHLKTCPINHPCMNDVSPHTVTTAVARAHQSLRTLVT